MQSSAPENAEENPCFHKDPPRMSAQKLAVDAPLAHKLLSIDCLHYPKQLL